MARDDAGAPLPESGALTSFLARTVRTANAFIMGRMEDLGMKGLVTSHGDILAALFACEPRTMQDLAEQIGRDPSTVTALVKKLASAGYVTTHKSEQDRRVTEVALTEQGRALEEGFQRISRELMHVQMKGINADDLETTCRVLRQIEDNLINENDQEK